MRHSFTKEELEQYKGMMQQIANEDVIPKSVVLYAELDQWLQHKSFTNEVIDKMDKRIEAEEKGIRVIK